ncbi:MAG: hypothetical protein AAF170_01620 [Bacteroidota bacterium]
MRVFLALVVVLVAACDTDGIDPSPFSEGLIVEIEDETVLRLTTDGAPGCATPMVIESEVWSDELAVDVLGLALSPGCLALIPSTWTRTLPAFEDSLVLTIRHNSETDRYVIRDTPSGRQLEGIRSSVTRLGAG